MKILITPRSFAKTDDAPLRLLQEKGWEIVRNTKGLLTEEEMIAAIADVDGVILGIDPLNARVVEVAKNLKAVARYGVGMDNVDVAACEARGIKVSRTAGANSAAVADYAFALMLALARQVIPTDARCRQSDWNNIPQLDVSGKTLGLIGMGAIGKQMVQRAHGFSMDVMGFDVQWDEEYAKANDVAFADVDAICEKADFVSLHVPLLDSTRNILSAERIAKMKKTAYIINTARGGLIDDAALIAALQKGTIAGAGLDAFVQEPPEDKTWFTLPNTVIGSHCASATPGASECMGSMAAENLIRDLS